MLKFEEINALGDILNTSWGQGSTERGDYPTGTAPQVSIKGHIVGDTQPEGDETDLKMVLNYVTIVTFGPDLEMQAQQKRFEAEAKKILADKVKQIKSDYRGKIGKALKCKLVDSNNSMEIIYTGSTQLSMYTQRHKQDFKRAYVRHVEIYQVS